MVDVFIGYTLSWHSIAGVTAITFGLLYLYMSDSLQKRGQVLVIISALLAVATTSLYKYNITFYNSVAAEQTIVLGGKMLALFLAAYLLKGMNPFLLFNSWRHVIQAVTTGAGGSIISYTYLFAPASVVISAKRSWTVLAAIISGQHYFKEKRVLQKITAFAIVTAGVILLTFG